MSKRCYGLLTSNDLGFGKMGGLGVFNVVLQGSMEFSGLVHGKEALARHLVCGLHYG